MQEEGAAERSHEKGLAHGRGLADRMVLRALLIALDRRGPPDAFLADIRALVHEQISGLNTANASDGPLLRGIKLGAREVADMLTMPVEPRKPD